MVMIKRFIFTHYKENKRGIPGAVKVISLIFQRFFLYYGFSLSNTCDSRVAVLPCCFFSTQIINNSNIKTGNELFAN